MIDRIFEFIKNNKLITLLLLIVLVKLYQLNRKGVEKMTNLSEEKPETDNISNYVSPKIGKDKKVALTTEIDGKKHYLAAVPKRGCRRIAAVEGGNCNNTFLVLLPEELKNEFYIKYKNQKEEKEDLCNCQQNVKCKRKNIIAEEKSKCLEKNGDCEVTNLNITEFVIREVTKDKDYTIESVVLDTLSHKDGMTLLDDDLSLVENTSSSYINYFEPASEKKKDSNRVCLDGNVKSIVNNSILFIDPVSANSKLKLRLGFNKPSGKAYLGKGVKLDVCGIGKEDIPQVVLYDNLSNINVLTFELTLI